MDQPWDVNLWGPTHSTLVVEKQEFEIFDNKVFVLTNKELESLQSRLMGATKNIKANPYAFRFWSKRSKCLMDLGYPELAAGDSYKALLLCECALLDDDPLGKQVREVNTSEYVASRKLKEALDEEKQREIVDSRVSQGRQAAFHDLITALMTLHSLPDAIFILMRAIRIYPGDQRFASMLESVLKRFNKDAAEYKSEGDSFTRQKKRLSFGTGDMRVYPWEPAQFRVRQNSTIEAVNASLKSCSRNLQIRRSPILRFQDHPDCYGMFATRRIRQGATVLMASHIFASSLEQGRTACYNCFTKLSTCDALTKRRLKCCGMQFCSQKCKDIAKKFYHKTICGLDFTPVIHAADTAYGGNLEGTDVVGGFKTELQRLTEWEDESSAHEYGQTPFRFPDQMPVFMIRTIAACLQAGYTNLFEYPIIAQLSSNTEGNVPWTLNGMVSGPIKVLRTMGINVFEDHNWDTWVLVSMWNRVTSNSGSMSRVPFPNHVFSPLFFWFNHSCDPNARSKMMLPSQVETIARKDIQAGEEVFISVLPDSVIKLKKRERQAELDSWMRGTTCQCLRCLTEFE